MLDVDFMKQLDKQVRYIETSAKAYDAGDTDEAIRIATSLRVILHQTKSSTALLSHLKATFTRIMTTVPKPPYPQGWFSPLAYVARARISSRATSKRVPKIPAV